MPTPAASDPADGAAVFTTNCSACHQAGGVGAPGLAPPLASKQVAAIAGKDPSYVALIMLNGFSGPIVLEGGDTMSGVMPPVGASLSDEEVAAAAGYVIGTLNGVKSSLDAATVAKLRVEKKAAKELRALREALLK